MKLYLRSISNPQFFRDAGDYPNNPPFEAPKDFEWVNGTPEISARLSVEKNLNQSMEDLFLSLLPRHIGKSYLTPQVVRDILTVKQAITDANKLGQFQLTRLLMQSLSLPAEMQPDLATLVKLLPS